MPPDAARLSQFQRARVLDQAHVQWPASRGAGELEKFFVNADHHRVATQHFTVDVPSHIEASFIK